MIYSAKKLTSLMAALVVLLSAGAVGTGPLSPQTAYAASAHEINASVDTTLNQFTTKTKGASDVLARAKGVLVFPSVYQGGFVFGGEYGEGALRVNGKTTGYYNIASGSWGFQLGAQKKSLIFAFMTDEALADFQNSAGWTVGGDASVAVIAVGAEGSIKTSTLNQPVLAFVTDQKGLMYNLTLEGTKITKINKK